MSLKLKIIIIFTILFPLVSHAQFYAAGDNPASVRWSFTETPHYRVIYPRGLDSLARDYGMKLEKYRVAVGRTAGFTPGEFLQKKMPVVLHAYNAASNGSVAWAPMIMNLYTTPSSDPEALPWSTNLSIHESRHTAQMQAGLTGLFKPTRYLFGEMFNGLVAGLYSTTEMLEGDAVVAETALSKSGRGRSADFLNYYMIAFDHGDFRSWEDWRFGSQIRYTPDQYAAGYFMIGGLRHVYGYRDVIADSYRNIIRRPYDIGSMYSMVRKNLGIRVRDAYFGIADSLNATWQKDIAARAPFMYAEPVTKPQWRYTEYTNSDFLGNEGHLWTVRSSIHKPDVLVRIDGQGREEVIGAFSSSTSNIRHSEKHDCIYWSEVIADPRWTQKVNSVIRYKHFPKGHVHNLTRGGRLYNPHHSPSEDYLSVTECTDDARSHVVILDFKTGQRCASVCAPDSLQLLETVWDEDRIYATALSDGGYGLYSIGCNEEELIFEGPWIEHLAPLPVKMNSLSVEEHHLLFTSDRNGVNELYDYNSKTGKLYQLTSTRYGATDFAFSAEGDTLYFTAAEYEGKPVMKTPTDSLPFRKVDIDDIYRYEMADHLSRQEAELAAEDAYVFNPDSVTFSEPKKYRKAAHLFDFHSWAPFYFDVDNIMAFSFDRFYEALSLGAAAISQNRLGTAVSRVGYAAHPDPYEMRPDGKAKWRHSGHFKFKYSGWYPVFELSVDFNDRSARNLDLPLGGRANGKPYVVGNVSAYIPFNFSRGGWLTGLIPKVDYSISNDMGRSTLDAPGTERRPMQSLQGSLRFYTMRPTADAGVYPRWGFGAEAGAYGNIGFGKTYSPMVYGQVYGYLPGVIPQQGFMLRAVAMSTVTDKYRLSGSPARLLRTPRSSFSSSIMPRGYANEAAIDIVTEYSTRAAKFSVDYGIPIYIGDLDIWDTFMYIKRLVLTPHFDYSIYNWFTKMPAVTGLRDIPLNGDLWSAGATLSIDFRSLFWLEFPFSIGVTYSYNGGSAFGPIDDMLQQSGAPGMGHHFVGPVFNLEF